MKSELETSKLARELKKRKPFDVPEEEVFLNLIRTSQWLQHDNERIMKQHDLTSAGYNVLRILRGAGGDGLPSLEIASRMVTRVPDVTRLVDRLIERGLVKRTRQEHDRRVVIVTVTTKGLELLGGLDKPLVDGLKQQLAHMTDDEKSHLNRLLEKAREGVRGPCESEQAVTENS